jgi:hypothetical protein
MLFEAFTTRRTPHLSRGNTSISYTFSSDKNTFISAKNLNISKEFFSSISPAAKEHIVVLQNKNEFSRAGRRHTASVSGLLTVIGLPTHHSSLASFQIPASPIMEGIVDLHNDIMFFLVFIITFVLYLLSVCIINFSERSVNTGVRNYGVAGDALTHNTAIEVI